MFNIPFRAGLYLLFSVLTTTAFAQVSLRAVVVDQSSGEALIGVTVTAKGSGTGTITDTDGRFELTVPAGTEQLQFSYVGYGSIERPVSEVAAGGRVAMSSQSEDLSEVVVTALGIRREEKALGYSAQSIGADQLDAVRATDPFSALKGKVAGLEVNTSNNGLASSSRIVIRGENSLNINGNAPLIVIDGTPINNDVYGVGGGSTNQANLPTDYGNAALDVNPGDIESVNVLKGAAASALYGSRGGNGVIIITTKRGKAGDKLGIDLSTNTSFTSPLVLPQVQQRYGGGWAGAYAADFGTNFGPAFEGAPAIAQDGSPGFAAGEELPFRQRYDLNDFFETGVRTTNQLSVSGSHDRGSFRVSFSDSRNTGIVPNTDLKRSNLGLNTVFEITDKWSTTVSGSFITSGSDNLPVAGYGNQGVMYTLLWNYNNVDLDWLRDYWVEEDVQQNQLFSWGDNPFLIANENLNGFDKTRLFGNVSSTYAFTDEWSLLLRYGSDGFDDLRTSRRPWSAVRFPNGMYREQSINFNERNIDALLTWDKRHGEAFTTVVSVGANRMDRTIKQSTIQGDGLAVPGIYTLGNINVQPSLDRFDSRRRINSVYAFANIGYRDFLYLDLTARNDWSSTLPAGNNSYFYPSISVSFLVSEIASLGSRVDYLKLRANVAQSGLDTDPFSLRRTYSFATLPNSLTNQSVLPNAELRPVTNTSFEAGVEARFFGGRLSADVSAYKVLSRDQIIRADISEASGFNSIVVNAGEIETNGLEVSLNGSPVRTNDFEWNVGANFSTFRAEVNELYRGLETFIIANGPAGATVEARPGGRLGDVYGNVYDRAPNGEIIFNDNGLAAISPERQRIGNYNPDFLLGLSTRLTYRGLSAYALLDIREGGYLYSYTNAIGAESGLLTHSARGHEEGIVGEGVMRDADGNFVPNTTVATAEAWYYSFYSRDNVEANGFDASFVKLREVSLSYQLPEAFVSRIGLGSLSVALTGNNVALWTEVPNVDPEAQALNGGTLVPGFEVTQLPSTRAFGFRLNLGF